MTSVLVSVLKIPYRSGPSKNSGPIIRWCCGDPQLCSVSPTIILLPPHKKISWQPSALQGQINFIFYIAPDLLNKSIPGPFIKQPKEPYVIYLFTQWHLISVFTWSHAHTHTHTPTSGQRACFGKYVTSTTWKTVKYSVCVGWCLSIPPEKAVNLGETL